VEFRILGPTEVLLDGRPVPLPKGRGRALLGVLLLRAGEVVSTDRLIDDLWGESPPATVHTALQGLVSKLRRRLEPQRRRDEPHAVLLTRHPGYLLAVQPGQIDAHRFRRLVAEADETSPERAAAQLSAALALWRGPALVDFAYEPFAQHEIAELEELRLTAVEKRSEAELASGRHHAVIGDLEALAAQHPTRERARELLMLALYRAGRQAQALEVYADVRRVLLEQLGLDPAPSLQRLERRILSQDPALDLGLTPKTPSVVVLPWLTEARKTVTVLSVDVTASTAAGEEPDAEAARRILGRFFEEAATVVSGHGGTTLRVVGDALVGIFGVPQAREDDALRAVRAAVDLRHLAAAFNHGPGARPGERLAVRTGIDTGEVVVGAEAADITGTPVRGAARLQRAAGGGEILVGETTRVLIGRAALVEPLSPEAVDGYDRPAWRVLDLVPWAPPLAVDFGAPMIGRTHELQQLRAAVDGVASGGRPYRLTLLGEPGIGKSRLASELRSQLAPDIQVLTGHCVAHGRTATFWPLREIVLAAAGRADPEAILDLLPGEDAAESIVEQVRSAIGVVEPSSPPVGMFPLLRRFFEALARRNPLVLILEDLHWAQPTFLDLVEYLTEHASSSLLLLCLARPELTESRPSWLAGTNAGALVLGPLGPAESRELALHRAAGRMIAAEVVERVVTTAQGNPLFVEQLLAAVGDEGELLVPATVQALLAARIDRLGPAERDLIRSAAVLGRRFPLAALQSLLPEQPRRHAQRHLRSLERKQLTSPARDSPRGLEVEFRHVLVQQAAYRSLTKQQRAELHEQAAAWLDEAGDPAEAEEAVGYHLEQAYRYRRELDDLDTYNRELGARAGEKLAAAGIRAFDRFDAAGAENLLSRARGLLPAAHPRHGEVGFRLAEAHETMGRHRDADVLLSALLAATADIRTRRVLELERIRVRLATGPDPMTLDAISGVATSTLGHFETAGDDGRMAQALFVLAEVHLRAGRTAQMEAAARRGLSHADHSDSTREQLGARRLLATALEVGSTPVADAVPQCEELCTRQGLENPAGMTVLARLRSMQGEFDAARELIARADMLLRERSRARRPRILLLKRSAEVEILAGDLVVAEGYLRAALALGRAMEIREETSEIAALLSWVLSRRGAVDEAAEAAGLSARLAPRESVTAQARWRSARALVHAARGEVAEAVQVAETAVDLVPAPMLNLRADLHVELADVLVAAGRAQEAQQARRTATVLYSQKGNLPGARLAGQ
jgi:DNA-binding SARP family transcriptional activator